MDEFIHDEWIYNQLIICFEYLIRSYYIYQLGDEQKTYDH